MANNVLNTSKNFLFKTQNTIISAAFVIASLYGVSALLGLVRGRLLARYFGTSTELAVFYTADKIPSFIYSLLVIGTLSTVFIPVFAEMLSKSKERAWHTSSTIINGTVLAFVGIFLIVFAFSEPIINALAVGQFSPEEVALGVSLMRIMLAAQVILVVSSFLTGVLHSFKRFFVPALAPVMYNLGMILGIAFLSNSFGIYGAAIGVVIGAVLHLLIQIPAMPNVGFKYKPVLDFSDKGFKDILRLTPPRILGSGVNQLSGIINNSLAILIATSSVVTFRFALQLSSFPVLLFGASMAQAALPTLSFESSEADREKFKKTFLTTFHQTLFLVVPASLILLVLRVPIVRLVFGDPNFSWEATLETATILGVLSFSVFAQASLYLVNRAFFALKDTVTPVVVSIFTLLLSLGLSLLFIYYYGYGIWAVALSFSITTIINLVILLIMLSKKVDGFGFGNIFWPFFKICMSAFLMFLTLYGAFKLLDIRVLDTSRTINLIILTISTTFAGMISYLFFTWILRVEEIELFYKLLRRIKLKKMPEVAKEHSADVVESVSE